MKEELNLTNIQIYRVNACLETESEVKKTEEEIKELKAWKSGALILGIISGAFIIKDLTSEPNGLIENFLSVACLTCGVGFYFGKGSLLKKAKKELILKKQDLDMERADLDTQECELLEQKRMELKRKGRIQ